MDEKKEAVEIVSTDSKVDGWMLPAAEANALLSSEGQPLPPALKAELERELKTDLSGVRVHQGENAFRITRATGARAFSIGEHIFLNTDSYSPVGEEGKHLLAHELTHTLQQGGSAKGDSKDPVEEKVIKRISDLYK